MRMISRIGEVAMLFAMAAAPTVTAFAAFDSDTVAFYSFKDGTGDVGDMTIANEIDSTKYAGSATVVSVSSGTGSVTFDDDVPGKYIFTDVSWEGGLPEPVCVNPKSIYLTSSTDDLSGGRLEFADIGTALSGMSEGTIEFFFKIPSDETYLRNYTPAMAVNLGLQDAGGTNRQLCATLPMQNYQTDSNDRRRIASLYASGRAWGSYATAIYPLNDGRWHHLAITMKVAEGGSATFTIMVDHTYFNTLTGYSVFEMSSSNPFRIGSAISGLTSTFHGKISCLRLSRKVLTTDEMLKASNCVHYHWYDPQDRIDMPDTIAFYTFKCGEGSKDGVSVGNKAYIFNNILNENVMDYVGYARIGLGDTDQNGDLVFDSDAPGPYIFTNNTYGAVACVTNPMSLYFSGTNTRAFVEFADIGTALSTQNEYTVEFFWKMPVDVHEPQYSVTMLSNCGLINPDGQRETYLYYYMPLTTRASGDTTRSREIRITGSTSGVSTHVMGKTYPEPPEDGLWHHLAFTYSNGTIRVYADYGAPNTSTGWSQETVTTSKPFNLGNAYYRGKIALLRVSKKALSVENMLHASTLPTYLPDTMVRWRLDGTAGVSTTEVTNTAPTFQSFNTNQYFLSAETYAMDYASASPPVVAAKYSASRPGRLVVDTMTGDELANGTSLYRQSTPKGQASDLFASGPNLRTSQTTGGNSVTVEGFFKFDYNGYLERIGNLFNETRHRVSLMVHNRQNGFDPWRLYLDSVKGNNPQLVLFVSYPDGTYYSYSYNIGVGIRNRWRHYAVVYDVEGLNISAYCDHEKVINVDLTGPLASDTNRYFVFGSAGNNQPFDGWIDEVRVTRRPLTSDEMLHVVPSGTIMSFR